MPFKKHKPEEIIGKLREVEIVLAQGASTAEECRRLVGADQAPRRAGLQDVGLHNRIDLLVHPCAEIDHRAIVPPVEASHQIISVVGE